MHCQWHQWFDNGLTFKTNGLYNCKGYTYYPTNKIHCFNHPQAMSVGKVFAQYMAGGILDRLILHHMKSTLICVFIDICAYRKQYLYIYVYKHTYIYIYIITLSMRVEAEVSHFFLTQIPSHDSSRNPMQLNTSHHKNRPCPPTFPLFSSYFLGEKSQV